MMFGVPFMTPQGGGAHRKVPLILLQGQVIHLVLDLLQNIVIGAILEE